MRRIVFLLSILWTLIVIHPSHAADNTVTLKPLEVTATRSSLNQEETPASVTVITKEQIKRSQHRTVEDLLRGELGMDITQQGPNGGLSSVFIRGANSASTLVLIDGIQVNQNTSGGFNFADLTTDNIERVEILRGPQSTLWGADAVGGVINIVTKKGKGKPKHSFSFEGGSFATFKETANSSGSIDAFDYSLNISRTDSGGFSAANKENGNSENDRYGNTTLSTRLGYDFEDDARAEVIARYTHANNEFDSFNFLVFPAIPTDGTGYSNTDTIYFAAPLQKTFAGWWTVKLNPNIAHDEVKFTDPAFVSEVFNTTYTLDLQNNLELNKNFSLVFGGEYQASNGEVKDSFDRTTYNQGYYLEGTANFNPLILTAGFRHDVNSVFEDKTTYKFAAAYRIVETGTRFRTSYATGFRAPTFNDLFFPPFIIPGVPPIIIDTANPNLKPEEVKSWEIGVDQELFDKRLKLSLTYFDSDYDNLIQLDSFFVPQNLASAVSRGLETAIDVKAAKNLDLHLKHTWNETFDESDHRPLRRRAKHKFSASLTHHWREKLSSQLGVNFRGEVNDGPVDLASYTTVRAALSYRYSKNLKLTLRGENLFDEKYEEAFGYGTAGVSGYAGFVYQFD